MKCPICDDTGFKTPGRPCPICNGNTPLRWYDTRPGFVERAAIIFAVIALVIIYGGLVLGAGA